MLQFNTAGRARVRGQEIAQANTTVRTLGFIHSSSCSLVRRARRSRSLLSFQNGPERHSWFLLSHGSTSLSPAIHSDCGRPWAGASLHGSWSGDCIVFDSAFPTGTKLALKLFSALGAGPSRSGLQRGMSPGFAQVNRPPIILIVGNPELSGKGCGGQRLRNLLVSEEARNASLFQPALEQSHLRAVR
jgi:hypothetical protein